uniref:Small ribosomal subunit protein bS20c n=1 Tax=Dictyopteris divaricata TaxID=156996 RepID=A0A2I4Q2B2_9PHAE|nr:30S ribosomal protein S20 [Dictyopteris divaricata]YP_010205270.1 30S ribosomal protein S20 [Grateloupia livida]AQZ24979.1 30S ribosomal protein S20 [Dictyopteris divaricata]UAV85839.1 30S ribosomal protein S20 [Grateloupia livida]
MANTNSAKKRIRTNRRNNERNTIYKSRSKTFIKNYLALTQSYKLTQNEKKILEVKNSLNLALSQLDKAAKKNVYHKNNIARKKSNLLKVYNQLL